MRASLRHSGTGIVDGPFDVHAISPSLRGAQRIAMIRLSCLFSLAHGLRGSGEGPTPPSETPVRRCRASREGGLQREERVLGLRSAPATKHAACPSFLENSWMPQGTTVRGFGVLAQERGARRFPMHSRRIPARTHFPVGRSDPANDRWPEDSPLAQDLVRKLPFRAGRRSAIHRKTHQEPFCATHSQLRSSVCQGTTQRQTTDTCHDRTSLQDPPPRTIKSRGREINRAASLQFGGGASPTGSRKHRWPKKSGAVAAFTSARGTSRPAERVAAIRA
jgi:hypothetical protein